MTQFFLFHRGFDEIRQFAQIDRVIRHFHVKIGMNLKKLAKIFIIGVQKLINLSAADEHDLYADRDRPGFQRRHGQHAILLAQILNLQAACFQNALQGFPSADIHQDILDV